MTLLSTNDILGTLGPEFSFHDILRKEKMGYLPVQYFDNFDNILEALVNNQVQAILIATKNSIHGDVGKNAEMISSLNLEVVEDFEFPISLHIAAKTSIKLTEIKKIYAYPIAWNECQSFLNDYNIEHINSASNSQALIDLENSLDIHTAAISGLKAIEHFKMKVLCENVQNKEPNITTFSLVVKK